MMAFLMAFVGFTRAGGHRLVEMSHQLRGQSQSKRQTTPALPSTSGFMQEVPFELDATLAVGGSADAHPRRWDQTQDGDEGAYVTDTSETFTVRDAYEIGYNGVAGAKGRCHIHYKSDGTKFGAIVDLECP